VYVVPDLGALPYCGLAGCAAPMRAIIANSDLGHPLCNHLRQGLWLLDYYVNRLDW